MTVFQFLSGSRLSCADSPVPGSPSRAQRALRPLLRFKIQRPLFERGNLRAGDIETHKQGVITIIVKFLSALSQMSLRRVHIILNLKTKQQKTKYDCGYSDWKKKNVNMAMAVHV